jgi:hypothetical protein
MERLTILAVCLISALAIVTPAVDGQTNAPIVQNGSQGAATGRSHTSNVHPNAPISRNIARRPVSVGPRAAQMVGQRAMNLRPNYSQFMRPLNPTLAEMSARHVARPDSVQPNQDVLPRSENVQRTMPTASAQRVVAANNLKPISGDLANREPRQRMAKGNHQTGKNRFSYSDALRRNRREWHDRNWWRQHCSTIVFVSGGYYFLDGSYWYPAWGYDPLNNYYDYDGPVYTYGNLLPDEVIANVQVALQEAGYYGGPITGSLSVETRAALANYQRDQGLLITGAIDEPTIESLGLY